MASTAQLIETKNQKKTANPLAVWHLLSLDAPTVATLWTWFLAHANHIRLPLASPLAMAIAVWMLYAGDRLLDTRFLDARLLDTSLQRHNELEARHLFHHRHRRSFLLGIALSAVALVTLLPHLETAAIRLYLTEGALLFAWFLILHATCSAHRLPKEIAVGLFFAAAVFIPTVARNPSLRLALLPCAFLFATLCSLNCLFIYAWEHPETTRSANQTTHPTTRLALCHLTLLAIAVAIVGLAIALFYPASPRPIAAAVTLSALLLLILDHNHRQFSDTTLRAAADLVLLTPLALLPFLR